MAETQTKTESISNIFKKGRIFSIPHYQRDYAWQANNFDDLWEDLKEAHGNKDSQEHFLGTIVLAPNPQDSNILDIIDGQQRSTTLFLLRYALYRRAGLLESNKELFFKDGEPTLKVAPSNRDFFRKIIDEINANEGQGLNTEFEKEAQLQGQQNLFEVSQAISNQISDFSPERAREYLDTLNKMTMLELTEADSGKAIRLFQAVNDRGVSLSILDKLKSLLILHSNKYCEGALDQEINERFGELFRTIKKISSSKAASSIADKNFDKKIEERIFYYHALSKEFGDYKTGANKNYLNLKNRLKDKVKPENRHELKEWLKDYTNDFLAFTQTFLTLIEEESRSNMEVFKLFFVLKINTYFYPTLVRLKMNNILDDECLRLIGQADIVFYRLGSDHDAKAANLYKVAHSKEALKEKLKKDFEECATKRATHLRASLQNRVYHAYGEGEAFYYLFFTRHHEKINLAACWRFFDENGKHKTFANGAITREHIVPKNTAETNSLDKYKFETKEEFDRLVNSFGNLLPLEAHLNSKAKDHSLSDKKEAYRQSAIRYNQDFAVSEAFDKFGKEQIEARNKEILQWLTEDFFKDFI